MMDKEWKNDKSNRDRSDRDSRSGSSSVSSDDIRNFNPAIGSLFGNAVNIPISNVINIANILYSKSTNDVDGNNRTSSTGGYYSSLATGNYGMNGNRPILLASSGGLSLSGIFAGGTSKSTTIKGNNGSFVIQTIDNKGNLTISFYQDYDDLLPSSKITITKEQLKAMQSPEYYLIYQNSPEDHSDMFDEGFFKLTQQQQLDALNYYQAYFEQSGTSKEVIKQAVINLTFAVVEGYLSRAPKATVNTVDDFIKTNVNSNFQQNVKNAFTSDAKVTTLADDVTVYRYHGGTSSGKSYWYTPNQTLNPGADLALPSGNTYQYMDTYVIPKGTTILEGTVAPNFGQPGGGYQFYVPNPTVVIPK
ncbi:hypothetical protein HNQ80_000187 [Anaerosolibacter carboniphilus]|uniref:TNT domain-containing protein n=2 Tax=Anaerosolibacter carboniphilus TaxID=1417629 RepID=A0A841KPU2_9FIRM|nr:hypothetical protein [Anaerosolibacter carboniphilus]